MTSTKSVRIIFSVSAFLTAFLLTAGSIEAKGKQPPKAPEAASQPAKSEPRQLQEQKDLKQQGNESSAPVHPQFRKITLEEAKRIYDEGKAVFVDGRPNMAYAMRHIARALNCSLGDYDSQLAELKKKATTETLLVVYCASETCGLAEKVAEKLAGNGFNNIIVFATGWSAWTQANYPMEP